MVSEISGAIQKQTSLLWVTLVPSSTMMGQAGLKWTVEQQIISLVSWGSSAIDVFVVGGEGTILHYDGSTWSEMESGTEYHLYDIWGSSRRDVFAVGEWGTIMHYNGSTWSEMESGTADPLTDIWGSSSNNIFAIGEIHYIGCSEIILHYDGSTWSEMQSSTTSCLNAIWGSSGADIFAVGEEGIILHYDGINWSEMNNPLIGITDNYWLEGVWGNSGRDVFAVGSSGTILHYDEPPCLLEKLYGEDSEVIKSLRYFRDNVLDSTPAGREIIRLYYEWSPAIVKVMEEDKKFRGEMV